MDIKVALNSHELFKFFSREEVDRLSSLASEKRFSPGEVIYRKDTPTSHFFLVLEGRAALFLPGSRQRLGYTVSHVGQGEMFGLSPLLGFERYTVTAQAETPVTLLAIEAKPCLKLMKANPTAYNGVLASVAHAYYGRYLTVMQTLQGIASQLLDLPRKA